jgi:ComF family protein
MGMMGQNRWGQTLLRWPEIFLQRRCLLCDRAAAQALCPGCTSAVDACVLTPQRQLPPQLPAQLQVLAWARYQEGVRRLLTQLKYQNRPEVADWLGQRLAQTYLHHGLPRCTLMPIPLHPDRQAVRGYNQAELIARSMARFTGLPLRADYLLRIKATTAQHGLSLADRQQNLAQAFAINPCYAITNPNRDRQLPHPVLLIDDIYTTGATIAAASQTLTQAGLAVWGVAVVAR